MMSVTSEPKVPHTPSAESPTKSREAPVPAHTASGKTSFTFCVCDDCISVPDKKGVSDLTRSAI